jgi:hypothetical protein
MRFMIDSIRRVPRVFARALVVTGLSLAAVPAGAELVHAQGIEALGEMFDDPALASYRLTTANLDKFLAATQALQDIGDGEFDLDEQIDMEEDEVSLDAIASAIDSEPVIRGAINSAGMSSREYVTFLLSMMQAMFASIAVQVGGEDALDDMDDGVLKENVRFFMANQEAFEALDSDN